MELRSRDYRVSRPEARSADHLEAEPNFTSHTMYDFRMQKGYRAMSIHIDQTVDKDIFSALLLYDADSLDDSYFTTTWRYPRAKGYRTSTGCVVQTMGKDISESIPKTQF
ncbi:hypothetical protein ALC53_02586 [Atta colombica]|uniref:Uncharacterized protein n=1 Tax=Atta colombica TaxID=520822 RepID=A0A195BQH4_9HYME|nr:hypothetical protein ALC53_02586 [Atta colombica]